MKTLYIDVYFLLNFIIDLLAIYFAVIFSVIPSTQRRLIFGAFVGAGIAVLSIYLSSGFLAGTLLSVIYIVILVFAVAGGVGTYRKIKFAFSFYIVEFLIGGFVQFFYGILDKYLLNHLPQNIEDVGKRRLILFAIVILLCVGVLRLFVCFFSSKTSGDVVGVEVSFRGRCITFDAFCDTGNFVKDPFDLSPVLIVKCHTVAPLFPEIDERMLKSESLSSSSFGYELKKRIRLIPVKKSGKTVMMLAIKPDSIYAFLENGKRKEKISVTVAIDNEGGTYGGYTGLLPNVAIKDAFV